MRKIALTIGITALLAVVGLGCWNYVAIWLPVNHAIDADPRNEGIKVRAHFANYVDASTLVYDLRSISGSISRMDVFRALLQSAEELKSSDFRTVELAHQGKGKFWMDGEYFKQLGAEYGTQNPVFTMRTFAQHLRGEDGTPAFPEYSGGWLWVMTKELEQFSQVHDAWYLNDLTGK